jgi:hypothetical protein
MRRFLIVAAILTAGATALAGKTQVNPSQYVKAGGYYGRSDGIYQETNSKGLVAINNGTSGAVIGPSYRETFAYGANKGMSQLAWGTGLTSAGATTTVPVIMTFASGVRLMWAAVVTETLFPITSTTGLNIVGDLATSDGLEVFGGVLGGSGRPFVVGTDPAFYFCSTVAQNDVSGQTILRVGFRLVEAMNAVFANYTTYATIGPDAGTINISTELAGAGIVTTDTTQTAADASSHKYCVKVSSAGVVTYTIDGAAPTVTAAVTLTSGISVIPFVHFVESSDYATDTINLTLWEVGYTE